jgi:hypothetical protein
MMFNCKQREDKEGHKHRGFATKILYAFIFSLHACFMPFPSHPLWLVHSNYIWWSIQVMWLLIMQFSPSSYHSCLFSPNILLSTLCSNAFSLHSSFNGRDQVSHTYKSTGRIMVLYILSFTFFDNRCVKTKDSQLNDNKHYLNSICS